MYYFSVIYIQYSNDKWRLRVCCEFISPFWTTRTYFNGEKIHDHV